MFSIEPGCFGSTKEELRSICVWTGVRHRKSSGTHVIQLEVFIWKRSAVDWFSSCTVSVREIAALNSNWELKKLKIAKNWDILTQSFAWAIFVHVTWAMFKWPPSWPVFLAVQELNLYLSHKSRNNAMKRRSFVSEARSSIAKLNEVFGCFWDDIFAKLHCDFSNRLAICCHLEKAVWIWSGRNICVLERRSARISLPYRIVKIS